MLTELLRVALLGGLLTIDRSAGWNLMLGQPLVGACLAGALLNPGPEWEPLALRIPLGVGVLLQMLLTDPSLPAAQKPRDTATAGVVGASVGILCLERLHPYLTVTGGIVWVLVGTLAGLLAAMAGGWLEVGMRSGSQDAARRGEALALEGKVAAFEALYWRGVGRLFLRGASWSVAATVAGVAGAALLLPNVAHFLTGPRSGLLFAAVLGVALGAGYHAHVRTPRNGFRWAFLGALVAAVVLLRSKGGAP
ncbi:MAG TPA: hypothetical protein VN539_06910 [Candidatus Saccharimonadales bacterium]|nr:hypothetical protein [Candidatus Saccharimonadales bacterium]